MSMDQANTMSASAEQVSAMVSTVASAAEEMSASIGEIARNAGQAANITTKAEAKSQETKVIVDVLGDSAKQIGQVVEVIKDIAAQTNLLALNATIEAARAGEAGKGFNVVANEVKELAKKSAASTETIKQQIQTMQGNSSKAIEAINDISTIVNEISKINQGIASAVEEQSVTTTEISRSIQEASRGSQGISQNILGLVTLANQTGKSAESSRESTKEMAELASELMNLTK